MTRHQGMPMFDRLIVFALGGVLFAAAPGPLASTPPSVDVTYRVASVEGKLLLESAPESRRLEVGDEAQGGDRLRTGWFSTADLESPAFGARFRLGARTRVHLAREVPGVLLDVEKGRLRATFEALTGSTPIERRVRTPSAVLAVRGTDYGVHVGKDGATTLVVFEGVVEVADREGRQPPVAVRGGQMLRARHGHALGNPRPHALDARGWDHGAMPGRDAGMSGGSFPGMEPPAAGSGRGRMSGGGHGHGGG